MILAPLLAAGLIVGASADFAAEPARPAVLTTQQKTAALQPLIRTATECIARAVKAHPRFSREAPATGLGDLIVVSVTTCVTPVRTMIDAHDRYFGEGTGEAFFMGAYLGLLPTAVLRATVEHAN